jgi:hypothetical protein
LHAFEEICKRLREFEEIEISEQSCRGDCELEDFVWISSKNLAYANDQYFFTVDQPFIWLQWALEKNPP